jgi:hypothetical protein
LADDYFRAFVIVYHILLNSAMGYRENMSAGVAGIVVGIGPVELCFG